MKLNEEKAAAADGVTYSDIQVQSKDYNTGELVVAREDGSNQFTYEFGNVRKNICIGVTKGEYLDDTALKSQAGTGSASSLIDQRIVLKSINGVDVRSATDLTALKV